MIVFDWNLPKDKKNKISIIDYVEKHSNDLREDYFSMIDNIGNYFFCGKRLSSFFNYDNNSLWIMSSLFEKSSYKSIYIGEVIKILGIQRYLIKNKPKQIHFEYLNKDVYKAIKSFCDHKRIKITVKNITNFKRTKTKYKFLPNIVKALLWVIKIFFTQSSLRSRSNISPKTLEGTLFFCSYFSHLNSEDCFSGKFNSGIWGALPNLLKYNNIESNWLHHYIKSNSIHNFSDGLNVINKINKNSIDQHSFIKSYFSIKILLKVIIKYLIIRFKTLKVRHTQINFFLFKKINLKSFYKEDFDKSFFGIGLIENILWIELFDKVLKNIPIQKLGIYLQENQGWEFAFINAWKKNNHKKLVAIQHITVAFWDLRYKNIFTNENLKIYKNHKPDFFAINGKGSKKEFLSFGYDKKNIIELESLRYLRASFKISAKNNHNILILGDINKSNTLLMLDQIYPILESNYNWTFKSHPANPIKLEEKYIGQIQQTELPLKDILPFNNTIISSSMSSSGVESFLAGLKTIVFKTPGDLNMSPLKDESSVILVSSTKEILNAFQKKMPRIKINNYFNTSRDLSKWKKLLNII